MFTARFYNQTDDFRSREGPEGPGGVRGGRRSHPLMLLLKPLTFSLRVDSWEAVCDRAARGKLDSIDRPARLFTVERERGTISARPPPTNALASDSAVNKRRVRALQVRNGVSSCRLRCRGGPER